MVRRLPFIPDAIIAHWISGFADGGTLRELSRRTGAPALWYLLDMAPLTGGCHYSFGCEGYRAACGSCPQLAAGRGERDLSRRQWRNKAAELEPADITGVAASTWLRARLDQSSVFRHKRHETILLGVDVQTFRRGPAADARRQLGLPADRLIVFFGASSLHEERKGIRQLLEALRQLHGMLDADRALRDRVLVVMAGKAANAAEISIPFEHRHIGFLEGDAQLVTAYQAADLFVNPSVEDAGPMMVNEALLCGTPVVSFEMGVAADLVHTGETGYRARLRDAGDMAEGIRRILALSGEEREAMRSRCRTMGEERCDPRVQVGAFAALCRDLIQTSRSVA
jgi:glycosyltransferase involved in cell wall biosynthesis